MKIISKNPYLKVGDLKKILSDLPDDLSIMIMKVGGIGNVADISNVRMSKYSFMGVGIDCLILDNDGLPARRYSQDDDIELFE
jgi:hypothetical protein